MLEIQDDWKHRFRRLVDGSRADFAQIQKDADERRALQNRLRGFGWLPPEERTPEWYARLATRRTA